MKTILRFTIGTGLAALPAVARAAEEGGIVPTDYSLQIWTLVTFVVLLGLLAKFAFKPIAEALDHIGVLCVELFDTAEGIVANEIAPRVHNSGHWSIEGAVTSQFENHIRGVLGLPLGDPSVRGVAAMVNIVGTEPDLAALLAIPGASVHTYGKAPRTGRKLAHVTLVADSAEALAVPLAQARVLCDAAWDA